MSDAIHSDVIDVLEYVISNICGETNDKCENPFIDSPLKRKLIQKNDNKTVAYIYSRNLIAHSNRLPKVKGRAILVHELIKAYDLIKHMTVIECTPADESQLRNFHTEEYINHIKLISDELTDENDEISSELMAKSEEFGIAYDCPPLTQLYQLISHISGASICAADAIVNGKCDISINWAGGWHHAFRDEAAGYCYTNDIVFAILHLLQNGFRRIVYVDFDLHHGDGVENAFAYTDKVMTVSFHKYETGFFPGTGDTTDIGRGERGRYFSVNVPLKDGIRDDNFVFVVKEVLNKVKICFNPQVIIAQCGADCLVNDPMNSFNLTIKGYGECIKYLMNWNIPMIIVGGGGYNIFNTARCWTYLTSCLLNQKLDNNIPDHLCFLGYRPSYELHIDPNYRTDFNTNDYITNILKLIFQNLRNLEKKLTQKT